MKMKIQPFAVLVLLAACVPTLAATGFVAGSKVSRVGDLAAVTITFNCDVQYIEHDPESSGSQLRLRIEPTPVCTGVSPTAAISQERFRPASADLAKLVDIEYDGESTAGPILRLNFDEDVNFAVDPFTSARNVIIRVRLGPVQQPAAVTPDDRPASRMTRRDQAPDVRFVINLQSSERPPATADLPKIDLEPGLELMVTTAEIDGRTWHRIRVGYYESADAAARALSVIREQFPTAWIDRDVESGTRVADSAMVVAETAAIEEQAADQPVIATESEAEIVRLMAEGRRLMTAGELPRAVQIYTKVLLQPESRFHPEAQEFLALARERNGQIAHAKAEYERYLDVYPDNEGADRVRQRLAALIAQPRAREQQVAGTPARASSPSRTRRPDVWTFRSFLSQYYRRNENQLNDGDQVVNQSALYTDVNIDARRRGERFDFSTRITAGYRKDFLDEPDGDEWRVSYAFVDLADAKYSLRGRAGRQSRNTGGVLGRFDGLNLSYQATDRLRVDGVVGKPVNTTADSIDDSRTFYGLSTNFGPIADDLEIGAFFIQQSVEDLTDRQAIGAEMRYFGENKSLWGIVDYDTSFNEVASVFLQGSWRLPSSLTLTGLYDQRRSPLLSMSNALIGQPVTGFDQLIDFFTEDELRQLALDRAANTRTTSIGASMPLSPKFQLNANASRSLVDATPESGGVFATPQTTYLYVSTDFVGSSLITEGDVSLIGLRFADSENTAVYTVNLDTRFPIGNYIRFNPRVRVDYREIKSDSSTQWVYTPGIRIHYRKDRRFRIEFEAGMQISSRDMAALTEDRKSYFANIGYQFIF